MCLMWAIITESKKPESCAHPRGQQERMVLVSAKGDGKMFQKNEKQYTCLFLGF